MKQQQEKAISIGSRLSAANLLLLGVTARNKCILLLDAELYFFMIFFGVLIPSTPHTSSFWPWRNDQTMGSDNWFWRLSVTIFVKFVGSSF